MLSLSIYFTLQELTLFSTLIKTLRALLLPKIDSKPAQRIIAELKVRIPAISKGHIYTLSLVSDNFPNYKISMLYISYYNIQCYSHSLIDLYFLIELLICKSIFLFQIHFSSLPLLIKKKVKDNDKSPKDILPLPPLLTLQNLFSLCFSLLLRLKA